MLKLIAFSRCMTCKRARDFLDRRGIDYIERDIISENPTANELNEWLEKSGIDYQNIINTSASKARELGLKKRLDTITKDEVLSLLSEDGTLIKRPILVGEDKVLFGFKESDWAAMCN